MKTMDRLCDSLVDYGITLAELIKTNKHRADEEPGGNAAYYQGKVDAYTLALEYFLTTLKKVNSFAPTGPRYE